MQNSQQITCEMKRNENQTFKKYLSRMPRGEGLSFNFDLIWLENEELQDNERERFSKSQQRQRLATAKRHVMMRANMCWHGGTTSHSAEYSFPNAELSLHNLSIFGKFMK